MMGDVGKQPRDHCPTCGVPVKVVGGEEGTFYYAPLVVAPDLLSVDPHREELEDGAAEFLRWYDAEYPHGTSGVVLWSIATKLRNALSPTEEDVNDDGVD